jgi:hypothetical protein
MQLLVDLDGSGMVTVFPERPCGPFRWLYSCALRLAIICTLPEDSVVRPLAHYSRPQICSRKIHSVPPRKCPADLHVFAMHAFSSAKGDIRAREFFDSDKRIKRTPDQIRGIERLELSRAVERVPSYYCLASCPTPT